MDIKKSPKVDLESKRGMFLEIGFTLALAFVLLAFEWQVDVSEAVGFSSQEEMVVEEEIIPITRQDEVKPPPPPPPPPKIADVLNIVDNEEEIEEELIIEDSEADIDEKFEIVVEEEEDDEAQVFVIVEKMPVFPGGNIELQKWIASSVKYPIIAQENGIQGRVFVTFVIDKKGKVTQARVLRSVDQSLDKEALRVINNMPDWEPGKQRGKPVKVSYTVPINFQLQ